MKLIITRHGQTYENTKGIIQGQKGPGRLNKLGIKQAKRLAQRLKNEKIDIAYISDIERTEHTAREILKYHKNTKVFYSKELREQGYGFYEGKHKDEFLKARDISKKQFHQFKPEGGESIIEVQKRIKKFYYGLINKHENETILLVTHGNAIASLLLYLFKKPLSNFEEFIKHHPQNTAITILEIDENNRHKVNLLNCTKHID